MSNLDQRMLWVLTLLVVMIARPVVCQADSLYLPFQTLLDRHLTESVLPCDGLISWFDYDAALAEPETIELLKQQDALLAGFVPATMPEREGALAFWINAYNYFMLQHILTHPEDGDIVDSVRDYGSLFRPYRVFGMQRFNVGGADYSLRDIELEILLGQDFAERGWKDARVHFAVNCASVGCPPLRESIYQADTIDQMLSDNTQRALDTPLHLRREANTLYLTELFDWYEDDFVEHSGSIREFIVAFGSEHAQARSDATDRVRHIDYDWRLNVQSNFDEIPEPSC